MYAHACACILYDDSAYIGVSANPNDANIKTSSMLSVSCPALSDIVATVEDVDAPPVIELFPLGPYPYVTTVDGIVGIDIVGTGSGNAAGDDDAAAKTAEA